MKRLATVFFAICLYMMPSVSVASPIETCMQKIADDKTNFIDILNSEIIPANTEMTKDLVLQNKPKILTLLAANVLTHCAGEIMFISDADRAKISFIKDDKKYAFDFSVPEMFEYINLRAGIMVYNNRSKSAGDVIKLTDIPKLYWSDDCSDHTIWENLDDDAAVNVAGQSVFTEYGGKKNEFFLDFEKGNNRRAFPGLVLCDKTRSTKEEIVSYTNLIQAKQVAQKFASELKNSACINQNLAVYVVALDTFADTSSKGNGGWVIGASVAGGTMALIGIGAALATTTAAAATGSMLVVNSILGAAAVSSTVPVAGWIVAGVLTIAAGVIVATKPQSIQDIQQVMVLAGPYNI